MALYTQNNLIQDAPLTLEDTEVTFFDYLKAASGDAWADNPSVALKRLGDVYTAQVGEDTVVDLAMSNDLSVDLDSYEPTAGPELSMDEQADIIKAAGLETHLKAQKGYNREALDIIMGRKREELDRALTREQAPAWMAPFGFAAGLVTSFADPINLASNFIPVVGEQRVLRLLQQARTPMGRAGVRAGIGAAEGAVGAAVVEPLVYLSRTQEQADYDMTDSLLNVAFGAIMGGAMHSATGAIGDWVRSRRGQRQPWEVKAPTDQSELRRTQFADELFSASQEAGADITREQAEATAVLFDARARTWAYDEGKDAVEYYDTWKPDFRAAVDSIRAEANLEQSMKLSSRSTAAEFQADARDGAVEYFLPSETPDALRAALEMDDLVINLPSNFVQHLDKNHAKMADDLFANTVRVLQNADTIKPAGMGRRGKKYSIVLHEGDQATIVVAEVVEGKKKGRRVLPITAYKNSAEVIDAVVEKHSRAARSTGAGGDPSVPKPLSEDEVRAFAALEESMADEVAEVKRPAQQMQEAITRDSSGPDVNDPAIGPRALEAAKRRQDIRAAIMGTEAQPTSYIEADPNVLYQLIGETGATNLDIAEETTLRLDNLEQARRMEASGKKVAAIKKATGWERGADGKWRYEIMDTPTAFDMIGDAKKLKNYRAKTKRDLKKAEELYAATPKESDDWDKAYIAKYSARKKVERADAWAKLAKHMETGMGPMSFRLRDLIDDPELFEAYPDLEELRVEVSPGGNGTGATVSRGNELVAIRLYLNTSIGASRLLRHEIQHAIQDLEGFARGGTVDEMLGSAFAEGLSEADIRQEAFARYRRIMGEVEAYNVMRRMDMSEKERRATPAMATEDVARKDQIFLERGYQTMMAMAEAMDSAPTVYGRRAAATYGRTRAMAEPRAQVHFDPAAEGKAVIDFFKAADPTSAPHELYHIFRRELASTAMGEGASEKSKRMWKEACDFVGAKEGQPWTRAQEEKFAQAGERFLMEGVAPRPELQGLFERLKQWFLEVYTSVEAAGFEISDGMRKVFGDMLALSPEESDAMFRYGLGRMMEQSPADGIDTSVVKPMDESTPAVDVLATLQADTETRLNESFARLNPDSDAAREIQQEFKDSMAAADAELEKIQIEAEILREAALCDLRR